MMLITHMHYVGSQVCDMIHPTTSLKKYSLEARDDGLGDGGPPRMEGWKERWVIWGTFHSLPSLAFCVKTIHHFRIWAKLHWKKGIESS